MPTFMNIAAAALFAAALVHTFSTKYFEHRARRDTAHAGLWHLLAEVEVVFGFWAAVLVCLMFAAAGREATVEYLESRNFTEPMFVFAIMVVAGTRPVLASARLCVGFLTRLSPVARGQAAYFLVLSLAPLLGSLITEPAAMTLAALMLRDSVFTAKSPARFKYATLGTLFVNVSIGGVLTPFAAPPVLMVAGTWGWNTAFMLEHFGWKAVLAVCFNALAATLVFRRETAVPDGGPGSPTLASSEGPGPAADSGGQTAEAQDAIEASEAQDAGGAVPLPLIAANLAFLALVVVFSHFPAVFMGLFLIFLGVANAYERHVGPLILREGLLVACFLGGLVVLGGMQRWWLSPVLMSMSSQAVYFGAAALTAVTDNAALTYLGSLVQGLSPGFKYALVAGAVAGGGLTIVANAPNPAGIAILRGRFDEGAVNALHLLAYAAAPTAVALAAFWLL